MSNDAADVDVHVVGLDIGESTLARCRAMLSEDETKRASRFVFPRVANRWIIARARLRETLSYYCGTPPRKILIAEEERGKPVLARWSSDPGIHFNLSHSSDAAVIAISRLAPIGVDIELVRPIGDWKAVARRTFSPRENADLFGLPEALRMQAFYRCWTRKEAIIKATGEGMSARLDSFDVSCVPGDLPKVLADNSEDGRYANFQLRHFGVGDRYVGAVAMQESGSVNFKEDHFQEFELA